MNVVVRESEILRARQKMRPSPAECSAMRHLWLAVLTEQIRLSLGLHASDEEHDGAAARRWMGSRDFHTVCDFAGIEGDAVLFMWQRLRQTPAQFVRMRLH